MLVRDVVDHLLLGVSDLDRGIGWFEQRAGVRAVLGGVHPGRGTQNALVALGEACYLEIIAPDPAQMPHACWFSVNTLPEPRLITFAARTDDLDRTAASLRRAGLSTIGPSAGARRTAMGGLLRWKMLGVKHPFQSGEINPIPFWIEWASDSPHPAENTPAGCVLQELRFEHPQTEELEAAFRAMDLVANVTSAQPVRLVARLQTPKGQLELA